jgi:arabinofuranosyltransferase
MSQRVHTYLGITAAAFVGLAAYALAWMSDDAYISIRYADHFARGLGLVFNPGEAVEGYSNFLWTLWCAVGLLVGAAVGVTIELWCHIASITAAVATVAALFLLHIRHRSSPGAGGATWSVPLACLGLAVHRDFLVHSTSGLETALFTVLILAAFVVLTAGPVTLKRAFVTGLILGLAALTRPDAPLVAAACGVFVLWRADRKVAAGAAIFAGFALLWAPHLAWRYSFYGSLVPNTALAKSAHLAWWSQGFTYVALYVQRYPVLLIGPALLAFRAVRQGKAGLSERPDLVLAAAIALLHAVYVARVGGDFMFARFLIPVTPLLLWSLEGEVGLLLANANPTPNVSFKSAIVTALVCAVIMFVPAPITGTQIRSGIADEHGFYTARPAELGGLSPAEMTRDMGVAIRPLVAGLPVRILVIGSQARLAWESRAETAIEANGLTDRTIASQPITKRGRPGHEKHPTFDYIVHKRRVHFAFSQAAMALVRGRLPMLAIQLGAVQGLVLTWDTPLMTELSKRGAVVPDYLGMLDTTITQLPRMSTRTAQRAWAMHRDFYFNHNADPSRRAAFDQRLPRD